MAKKEKSKAAEKVAKAEKASRSNKPKASKGKAKENAFLRAGKSVSKFFKDFRGEIKKIVWPDRKTVIKSTGIVLLVVAVIGLIIFLIDTGLVEGIRLQKTAAENFNSEVTTAAEAVTEQVTAAVTEASASLGG